MEEGCSCWRAMKGELAIARRGYGEDEGGWHVKAVRPGSTRNSDVKPHGQGHVYLEGWCFKATPF